MTAVIVALLTIPLAALRPFQQPVQAAQTSQGQAFEAATLPESFKVSFSEAPAPPATGTSKASGAKQYVATITPQATATPQAKWSCDAYPVGTELQGTSTHIDAHNSGSSQILHMLISTRGRCTEAALDGKAVFSPDETRIAQLSPGGFARFRERTSAFDRAVSITPVGDGSLSYSVTVDGRSAPMDATIVNWLGRLLPEVLREAAINVPERVARYRQQGGVSAVLKEISLIHSSSAKRAHYEELIKHGPSLSESDAEKIALQVGRDLSSSGDLSAVLQMLPLKAVQSPGTRNAIENALSHIASSGDKSSTLQVMAPNADPEMLVMLARAAEDLPSSGDKADFLTTTASEYLANSNDALRKAFFRTVATIPSSGDKANVLMAAMPYSHANAAIPLQIVATSEGLASSGDAANVLMALINQGALQAGNQQATLALIERTLTMSSSGDRANVLMTLARTNLLSNTTVRDAFIKAAMALPSDGDRANVLASAARR